MAEKAATIGLRFEDIRIPRGATVESAALIFVPAADEKEAISWTIQAEKTGDSAAFAATNRNLSNRRKTGARATWALPDWQEDEPTESVDLRTVVQESREPERLVRRQRAEFSDYPRREHGRPRLKAQVFQL